MYKLSSAQIDDLLEAYSNRLVDSMTTEELEEYVRVQCRETFQFRPEEEIFDDIHLNLGQQALAELLEKVDAERVLEVLQDK
jgi:lysophospholipase L1-like esterase